MIERGDSGVGASREPIDTSNLTHERWTMRWEVASSGGAGWDLGLEGQARPSWHSRIWRSPAAAPTCGRAHTTPAGGAACLGASGSWLPSGRGVRRHSCPCPHWPRLSGSCCYYVQAHGRRMHDERRGSLVTATLQSSKTEQLTMQHATATRGSRRSERSVTAGRELTALHCHYCVPVSIHSCCMIFAHYGS